MKRKYWKSSLAMLLSALIVSSSTAALSFTANAKAATSPIILGDADGSGIVDIIDVTTIQRHISELELLEGGALLAADVNGDGEITVADATEIQAWLAGYVSQYAIGQPITGIFPLYMGDVNGDGAVTEDDATLLQRYLDEYPDAVIADKYLVAADTNEDDNLSIKDVTEIQRYLANIPTKHVGDRIILLGDANGDDRIDVTDVTAIQRYINENYDQIDDEHLIAADVNGDGEINIADATALQLWLAEFNSEYRIGKPVWAKMKITDFSASSAPHYCYCDFNLEVENAVLKDGKLKSAVIEIKKAGEVVETIDYLNDSNSFYSDDTEESYKGKGFFTATVTVEDWDGNIAEETIDFELQGGYIADVQIETDSATGLPTVGEEIRIVPNPAHVSVKYGHYNKRDMTVVKDGEVVTVVSDNYPGNPLFWTPEEAGTYALTFEMSGYGGGYAKKTVLLDVLDVLNVEIDNMNTKAGFGDNTTIPINTPITLNLEGKGGKAPYTYEVTETTASIDDSLNITQNNNLLRIESHNPNHTYTLTVKVTDALGQKITKDLTFTSKVAIPSSLSFSKKNATPGETLTISAFPSSIGAFPITSKFTITDPDGNTTVLSKLGATSAKWTPAKAGDYTIVGEVLYGDTTENGVANPVIEKKTETYTVKESDLAVSVNVQPGTNLPLNYPATVTATATGGAASYQYAFFYQKGEGEPVTVQDFSTKNTAVFNPAETGNYSVYAQVKDSNGNIVKSAVTYVSVFNTDTVTASIPATATVGKSCSLSAQLSDAAQLGVTYRFIVYYNGTATTINGIIVGGPQGRATWTPEAAGEYNITAEALYNGEVVAFTTATCNVTASEVSADCTLDFNAVPVNTAVTVKAADTAAEGVTYKYSYVFNGTEKTIKNFTANTEATFAPKMNGTYTVKVTAKNSYGATAEATQQLKVEAVKVTALNADKTAAKVGDTVAFTAASNAKDVPVTFVYTVSKDGKAETLTTNNGAAQWTPKTDGNYVVSASVLFNDTVVNTKTIPYTVEKKVNDNTTTIYYNGFSVPYIEYKIADGEWSVPVKMVKLPATAAVPGMTHKYTINMGSEKSAEVRFSTAGGKLDDLNGENYTFNTGLYTYDNGVITFFPSRDAMNNNTFVSKASVAHTYITLGKNNTLSCTAEGGSNNYQFEFSYKSVDSNTWTTIQKYDANNSVNFAPAEAGKYMVCIKAKDGNIVQKKYFTIDVISAVKSVSTLSADTIKKGESVTVNCVAEDGSGKFEYAVLYKKASSEKWSSAQAYSSNNQVVVTPAAATAYDIKVKIKDKVTGRVAEQTLSLQVEKQLLSS